MLIPLNTHIIYNDLIYYYKGGGFYRIGYAVPEDVDLVDVNEGDIAETIAYLHEAGIPYNADPREFPYEDMPELVTPTTHPGPPSIIAGSLFGSTDIPDFVSTYVTKKQQKDPAVDYVAKYKAYATKASTMRQELQDKFKAGGIAQTALNAHQELISTVLADFLDMGRKLTTAEENYTNYRAAYEREQQHRHDLQTQYQDLESRHFDIKKFSKFCDSLYKTLRVKGPHIETMEDLSSLTDFMYTRIIKSQAMTDEVP